MERLKDCNLEHCTPEEVGVNSSAITSFIEEINENNITYHGCWYRQPLWNGN